MCKNYICHVIKLYANTTKLFLQDPLAFTFLGISKQIYNFLEKKVQASHILKAASLAC